MRVKGIVRTVVNAMVEHIEWLRTFALNSAGLVTVEDYLTARGVSAKGTQRWARAFGRMVAKGMRAATGREPQGAWVVYDRKGRPASRRVFAYTDAVHLDAAWAAYADRIKEA